MRKWILSVVTILTALCLSGCGADSVYLPGIKGDTGNQGPVGAGCAITNVLPGSVAPYGGAVIQCADNSVLITNGASGQDGADGHDGVDGHDGADAAPTAYSITDLIDPCGTQGLFDEVFLVLANGKAIASFSENSNGKNTRLWEVQDGIGLQTTDSTGCVFSLQTVNHTRTITWTGGSKSWNVP